MYLWPWSALYKAVISCPRHLTLGQASDEYTDGPCIIRVISFPINHQQKRNEFSYLWLCTKAECVSTDGHTGQEHACLFTATSGTSRIEIRDVAISYTKRLAAQLQLPAYSRNFAARKRSNRWMRGRPHETASSKLFCLEMCANCDSSSTLWR